MERKLRSILAGLALSFSGISTAAPELVVQSGTGSAPVIAEKPASADGAALIDWFPAITTTALLGIALSVVFKIAVGVPRRKATVCRCTCCIRDEGSPLGFADQAVIPNHPELPP